MSEKTKVILKPVVSDAQASEIASRTLGRPALPSFIKPKGKSGGLTGIFNDAARGNRGGNAFAMSDPGIQISSVMHKAVFSVNEDGASCMAVPTPRFF